MALPSAGLRLTNGSNQYIVAPASATLNNLGTVTVVMWASLTTLAPAAQRNAYGKSTGNNNLVGFINATGINAQYGRGTQSAVAAATTSSFVGLAANTPLFWVFQVDINTKANNRLLMGTQSLAAAEPSAYATQRTGSGAHDDSAAQFYTGNGSGGGTTNTWPGTLYSQQIFNRILRRDEILRLQSEWRPREYGALLSWRFGNRGDLVVIDESGNGLHGVVAGSPVLDIGPPFRETPTEPDRATWKRALFAPSGTVYSRYYYEMAS